MRNKKKFKKDIQGSKKAKFKPGFKKRENKCVVNFDEKDRQEYLTGFHKRKLERRKAAVDEIKKKIKEEQSRVREERHKEYMKMLKERSEALEEAEDDLEDAVISKTESVQYDHPNHTVTVTTISDLDLSGAHLLGPATNHADELSEKEEKAEEEEKEEKTHTMPKKARDHIVNKKIRSLTAALSTYTSKRKRKGKQEGRRDCPTDRPAAGPESKHRGGRTSKCQRRRQTGRKIHHQD